MSGSRFWRKGKAFILIVLMLFIAAVMLTPAAGAQEPTPTPQFDPHYIYEPSSTSLSVNAGDPVGKSFDLTVSLSFNPPAGWWVKTDMFVVDSEDPFTFDFVPTSFILDENNPDQVVHVTVTSPEGTIGDTRTIKAKTIDGSGSPSVGQGSGVQVYLETIVDFPDPNLEAVIREAIGKPLGDIYQSDLDGLTELIAYARSIADLTGLEHCTSLTQLRLGTNQIGNISPLSGLSNLTTLWLDANQISDISPLSNLTGLTSLWLSQNQIGNISPISNLLSLIELNLGNNQVGDIEPLVSNQGISEGDLVTLTGNPLNTVSIDIYIPQLEQRGVIVFYDILELNPDFEVDKRQVDVGETVTFTNLTNGGTHPYTKAEWDFDGDGDIDITCEKDDPSNPEPMDTVHWAYTESGIYDVKLYMTDSAPTTVWQEQYDYITVEPPPTVTSVSPENGATDVPVDTVVTVNFSVAMDESTIDETTFTLEGSAVSGAVDYNPATYTATFTPDADLEYDHLYTATLSTGITDEAGNPLAGEYGWSFVTGPIAAIDRDLLDRISNLIDQDVAGDSYYRLSWNINRDQYKAWIATIAWSEGERGGYGAHSSAVPGSDVFDHKDAGSQFKFSTGIGPFQLDRGGYDGWDTWPTIKKLAALDRDEAIKTTLGQHYKQFNAGGKTLSHFADSSKWFGVNPNEGGKPQSRWEQVTGTNWNKHKQGKLPLDWNGIKNEVADNADHSKYLYENNVMGPFNINWNISKDKAGNIVKTDTGTIISFDGERETWLVSARILGPSNDFNYYYTYDEVKKFEVWVLDNNSDSTNRFKYAFIRDYSLAKGNYSARAKPDQIDSTDGTLAGITLQSAAITTDTSSAQTQPGTDVYVYLPNAVVTFNTVEEPGTTVVTTSTQNPEGEIPSNFRIQGQFIDITTTATTTGLVKSCIPYDPSTPNPRNLKLFHWEDGHWQDVTTHVDTDNHLVCGEVDSLSAFFVGEETNGEGGEGCFIATAAYGTSTAAELDVLRAFRDEVLLESTLGSQLVEWYYQTSPPVADFISEHEPLRTLVRELLVEPVVWVVEAMESLWRN